MELQLTYQDTSVVVENFSIIIKAPKATGLFLVPEIESNLLIFLKKLHLRSLMRDFRNDSD